VWGKKCSPGAELFLNGISQAGQGVASWAGNEVRRRAGGPGLTE
jgi:hypothetical protein